MTEAELEQIARTLARTDSRENILATSDESELHHVSDGGWRDWLPHAKALVTDGHVAASAQGETDSGLRERIRSEIAGWEHACGSGNWPIDDICADIIRVLPAPLAEGAKSEQMPAHRVMMREVLAWCNGLNGRAPNGEDIRCLMADLTRCVEDDRSRSPAASGMIKETATSTADLIALAEAIEAARENFLNCNFPSHTNRKKLEDVLWNDKGAFAPALRELVAHRSSQPDTANKSEPRG